MHRRLGAKMVNFGGWDMPVEYSGILAEHMATRTAAGLFDVSHMGEIEVRGNARSIWCNTSLAMMRRGSPLVRRTIPG